MEGLFASIAVAAIIVIPLLVLDAAALGFGADSRPTLGDDHRR